MRRAFALAGALLLASCGLAAGEATYPQPAKEVREALLHIGPPMFVFGSGPTLDYKATDVPLGEVRRVRWIVSDSDGAERIRLTTSIEELGPAQSRVSVTVEPPQGSRTAQVAERMKKHPSVIAFYKAAMAEQIAAALEHRDFDMGAIQGTMLAAEAAEMPRMMDDFDRAAKADQEREAANMRDAYRNQGNSGWGPDDGPVDTSARD